MIRALKLDSSVYEEVEHDKSATGQAMGVVLIASILGSIGQFFGPGGMKAMIFAAVSALLGWVLMSFVSLGIGKLLGGKSDMGELLRALGFAYTPQVFGIIPLIGWLLAFVLGLIAWVQALRAALDLSTGKAILTAFLSIVAFIMVMVPRQG
jgi:hypothetical protein